jgi:hypothetical protein
MHNFFVTGLPRSRTAWFSEWLPDCLHEGMTDCYTHSEYLHKLKRGDSSSGLVFFPLRSYFPDAPLVIIDRDVDDVAQSMEKIGLFNDYIYKMLKLSKLSLDKMSGMHVDFYKLDLRAIWEYLVGNGFDEERAHEFNSKNIQKINGNIDFKAAKSFIGGG